MEHASQPKSVGHRRQGWTALIGTCAFIALGWVLAAGAAPHAPTSPPLPARAAADPVPALRPEPPAPGEDGSRSAARVPAAPPAVADGALGERSFDCMIAANEVVDVGSAVSGVIQTFYVERGDYVEAGQVIAMLESSAERAALRVAQARADREIDVEVSRATRALRRKQSERAQALYDKNTLSLNQREQAETEANVAELEYERAAGDHRLASLQLEQARVALQRRMIVSPISGLVVERMMSRGEVIIDNDSIARIAQIDPLRIEVILPSALFGQIRLGDAAQVTAEAPYDSPRSAQVAIVDPIIDGASGTFGVRLLIPNADRSLPGGLRCQARFPQSAP